MKTQSDIDFDTMIAESIKKELPLDKENPTGFKYPFLFIIFKDQEVNLPSDGWYIDVDGQIDKYITGTTDWSSEVGNMDKVTPLLQSMIDYFAERNMEITWVHTYAGSAGPTHILRHGAIFRRMFF